LFPYKLVITGDNFRILTNWDKNMSIKKLALAGGVVASLMASTAYASVIDRPFFKVLGVVVVWGGTDFDQTGNATPLVSDFVLLTPSSGSEGADLIDGDVYSVITGDLDPVEGVASFDPTTGETSGGTFTDNGTTGVLDAADTLTAFGIDGDSDVGAGLVNSHTSSFYVASNAKFDIFAETSNVVATEDFEEGDTALTAANINFSMSIDTDGDDGLAYGGADTAQDPSTGGTGIDTAVTSLQDMLTQRKIFDGGRRTAAGPGTLAEQSVRFESVYTLDADAAQEGVQDYDLSMGVGTLQADVTYTVFVP